MPTDDYTKWYHRGQLVGDLYIRAYRYKCNASTKNLEELRRFWRAVERELNQVVNKCDTLLRDEIFKDVSDGAC